MFKEKVLSLGGAVVLMLLCIVGTYIITTSTKDSTDELTLPTLPNISTQKPADFTDEQLYLYACIDAFDAQSNEIKSLNTFNESATLVAFENDGVTLCYPLDEIKAKKPNDKARLLALLGLSPNTDIQNVFMFNASSDDIFRPAFNTDPAKSDITLTQCELTNAQELFINKLIVDASNKKIAYTRLGYTYDYKGNDIYGVTQYASDSQKRINTQTITLDDFLNTING